MKTPKPKSGKRQALEITVVGVVLIGLCVLAVKLFPHETFAPEPTPKPSIAYDEQELRNLKLEVGSAYSDDELIDYLLMKAQVAPHIGEYVNTTKQSAGGGEVFSDSPKIIILTQDVSESNGSGEDADPPTYSYGKYNLSIPREMRARELSDVNVVFLVTYHSHYQGSYTDGTSAYRWDATVTAVAPNTGLLSAQETFDGGDAPEEKSGGGDRYGSFPTDRVIGYIIQLSQNKLSDFEQQ